MAEAHRTGLMADTEGKPKFVYVIGCRGTRYAKIGITQAPRKRLKAVQANCPHQIVHLRLYVHGEYPWRREKASALEEYAHRFLKDHHLHGEWFELSDENLARIDEVAAQQGYKTVFSGKTTVPLSKNKSVPGPVERPGERLPTSDKEAHLSLAREVQSMLQRHDAGTQRLDRNELAYVRSSIAFLEKGGHYPKFAAHLKKLLYADECV